MLKVRKKMQCANFQNFRGSDSTLQNKKIYEYIYVIRKIFLTLCKVLCGLNIMDGIVTKRIFFKSKILNYQQKFSLIFNIKNIQSISTQKNIYFIQIT